MFGNAVYNQAVYLGKRSLDVTMLRKQVIANNIANVDTPHYKRHEITFESEMNRVLDKHNEPQFPLLTTDKRHIPAYRFKKMSEVAPRIHVEYNTNYRNDKNNVDIEKEIADEVKNTLHYTAVTTAIGNNFKRLKSVIV